MNNLVIELSLFLFVLIYSLFVSAMEARSPWSDLPKFPILIQVLNMGIRAVWSNYHHHDWNTIQFSKVWKNCSFVQDFREPWICVTRESKTTTSHQYIHAKVSWTISKSRIKSSYCQQSWSSRTFNGESHQESKIKISLFPGRIFNMLGVSSKSILFLSQYFRTPKSNYGFISFGWRSFELVLGCWER